MYQKTIKLLLLLCMSFVTFVAHAAHFSATVSENKVRVGEGLQLNLSLQDAKARQNPDFAKLTKDFAIYSQQQYSTYSSTNGVISYEAGWDITLIPLHEGELIIPSLQILTDNGLLATQEIHVVALPPNTASAPNNVNRPSMQHQPNSAASTETDIGIGVTMVASTNKSSAYVKEPLVYTLKIISFKSIMNVMLEDIKSNDATIDKIGEPKQYNQVINGLPAHVIEVKYYVTPISPGKISITPAEIRGEVQAPSLSPQARRNFFNNFFLHDTINFKPFNLRGDPVTITALAPAVQDKTWLPLQDLTISEEWNGLDNAKVGDTIIRKIKVVAKGGFSNQIPTLQGYNEANGLKIYADKPRTSDNTAANTDVVVGTKEETFTIIATQPGVITLPQISIPWWNLKTKTLEYAKLPVKTLNILPAAPGSNQDVLVDYSVAPQSAQQENALFTTLQKNAGMYLLIAGLVIIILALFMIIVYLLKRQGNNKATKVSAKESKKTKPLDAPITNVVELRKHILLYAATHWGAPLDLTLNKLGTFLTEHNYTYDLEVYVLLCQEVNAELYASNRVDLSQLIAAWQQLRNSVVKNKPQKIEQHKADYSNLNPT